MRDDLYFFDRTRTSRLLNTVEAEDAGKRKWKKEWHAEI